MESNKLFAPEIGTRLSAYITSVDTTSRIVKLWAQVDQENAINLENVMENLQQPLETSDKSFNFNQLKVGDLCCAKFEQDARWYRARVVSKCPGDRSVTVLFVDYGNIEVVDISKTRACPAEVASIPAQASECICAGVEAAADGVWSTEAASFLAGQADTEVSMEVVKVVHDKSIVVETFQGSEGDGQPLSEVLIQKGFACRNSSVQRGLKNVTFPPGAKERIYMSHIISPHQFWIQLHSYKDDITELMEGILAHKHEMDTPASVLRDIQTGTICAALGSDEPNSMYYRGMVRSIMDDNTADVYFVDYGDSQKTSRSNIKYLRPEFAVLPMQAIECTLKDIQPNPEWTEEIREYLELVTLGKELVGEVTGKSSEGKMYVQLKEQRGGLTLDIRDMLIKEGFAKSTKEDSVQGFKEMKLEFGKEYEVYVSDARGPGDFTCQLPESLDVVDTIAEELQNLSQTAKEVRSCDIEPGKACMAKYSEDNCWYRAKVLSHSTTGELKVRFVDFGNTETVSANILKELNQRMAEIPAQSIECSLPNIGSSCSKEAMEEFKKLVMDKPLTGKVVVITGGKHVLELTEKSTGSPVSIAEQMAKAGLTPAKTPSLMNGAVSSEKDCAPGLKPSSSPTSPRHQTSRLQYKLPAYSPGSVLHGHVMSVVNIGEFHCSPVQETSQLMELMDKLYEYYSQPDVESLRDPRPGAVCCAQFTEDDGWYRAVIRKVTDSGVLVRYVDYGNCEMVEMSRVKALKPDFIDLPPQCFEACLIDVVPTKTTLAPEFTKNFVDFVKDQPVHMKLFSRDQGGRYTVELTKDNQTASKVMKGFLRGKATAPPPMPGILMTDLEFIQPFVHEEMYQDVFVTDVTDPDVFWCQLLSSAGELNTLMEDMNKHYSQLNQEEETLHTCGLGVSCVAKYTLDEQWYRAVITGVCKSGDVEVRFVDYGNAEFVSRVNVKAIKLKYMQLPVQAIQCSLLGVLCKNDMWTERQMQQFSQMVLEKEFVAQIIAKEELENRYEIELFDHRGKNVNNEYGRVTQTLVSRRDHVKPPPKQLPVIPAPGAALTAISKGYIYSQQAEVIEKKETRQSLTPSPSNHTGDKRLMLKEETEQTAASDSSGSTDSTSSTASQQSAYVTAPSTLTADSRSSSCISLASSSSSRKGSVDPGQYLGFNQLEIKKDTTEKLALTHTVNPNQFFCQLLRDFQDIEDLSEKLQQCYSADELKEAFISNPEVGMRCCALYSEDSMWYRAVITDVLDQQVEVKFVDFGNTEMLDITDIRVLDEEFCVAPSYAIECSVAHIKPTSGVWNAKAIEKFSSLTDDKTLVGKVISVSTRGKALLELQDVEKSEDQPSVSQELVQAGFAREATPSVSSRGSTPAGSKAGTPTSSRPVSPGAVNQTPASLNSAEVPDKIVYKELSYVDGSVLDVMVSLLVSPSELWCQPVQTYDELSKLMEDMGTYYNKSDDMKDHILNPEVGQDCVARFSEDNEWYRAKITKVMGREVEVRYVDYGNSEKRLVTDLRLSKLNFSKLPQQAFKCSLQEKMLPYDGEAWSNEAFGHLQRLVIDKELKCIISGKQTKEDIPLYFTDLTCKQHISITQKMIEAQLARPAKSKLDTAPAKDIRREASSNPSVQPDSEVKIGLSGIAVVSYGDDPLKFWCQRMSQGSKLDELMDAIDAHCSSENAEEVGKLKPGHAVIAKYSVDQGWYRAEVKEAVSPRQYILQFIDYGNQEQVSKSNMRILKPEFALLPKQAFPCFLSKVENGTPEAKAKFAELTAEAQLKLTIVDKKQDSYEVELEIPESAVQVNNEILKMVTAVNPPADHSLPAPQATGPQKLQQEVEREKSETKSQLQTSTTPKYPPVTVQASGTVPVYVSHCETPAKFWVQVADQEPQLNSLMGAVETSAQAGKPLGSVTQLSVGDPCCAQFSEDNGWYRGKIIDTSEGQLGVQFVDYGNKETVPLEKVQELQADLLKQPPFAVECMLDGTKPAGSEWSSVASSWFKEVTIERVLQAEFLDSKEPVRVKLSDGSEDIGKNMAKRGHAIQEDTEIKTQTSEASLDRPVQAAEVSSESLPVLKEVGLSEGTNVEVYVAVTLSPSNFWCQLASTTSELDSLMEKICDHYAAINNEEMLPDPQQGMPCIAQFSEDKGWYRAKVIKVDGDGVEVVFVDYGNSEKVERSLVKMIKPQFTELPVQAFQCSLANITSPSSVWDSDTTAKFTQLCTSQEDAYVIRVLGKDGSGLHTVELAAREEALKKGETVGKQLLAEGLAKPLQDMSGDATATTEESGTEQQNSLPETAFYYKTDSIKAGDRIDAYISFMDKSNHIWCQKVEQSDALGELMDTIDTHCSNLKDEEDTLNMPQEETACLAQYSEDGGWYRAKVIEVKEGSMAVQFVDFGNTEEVALSKVKQIKTEFLELPELAFECVLKNIPAPWEAPSVKRFSDLTNDKALTVDVQDVIKQDKKQVLEVILLDGDLSVNEALTQKTQKSAETKAYKLAEISEGETHSAYISSVVDPTKFYIQMEGAEDVLHGLMEKIQHCEHLSTPSLDILQAGTPVLAMYTVDDQWYRAQVLSVEGSIINVLYVDYGNSEAVGLERLKSISPEFLVTPPQAIECTLGKEATDLPEDITTVMQGLTEVLTIKFLHQEVQRWVVEVSQGETSLKDMVLKVGKEDVEETTVKTSTPSKDETGDSLQSVDPEVSAIESLPQPTNFVYAANDIDEGELQEGYVSHTTNPSLFFVQLATSAGKLDTLMKEINEEYGSLGTCDREIADIKPGMPCIVPFSEEGEEVWYRGRVQFTNHSVSVYYIDYGNEAVVPAECVKSIPPKFMTLPGQAIACSLSDVSPVEGSWPEGTNEKFLEFTEERQLMVEFNKRHGSGWNVRLLDGEESIGTKLTAEEISKKSQTVETTPAVKQNETPDSGLDESQETVTSDVKAQPESQNTVIPALQIGTEETVFYLCGESPDLFYCQLASAETQQNKLAEDIANFCTVAVEPLSSPVEGQTYLAQFSEDDQWYRAIITAVTQQGCHVRFVDYGNTEVVPCAKLRPLPLELSQLPGQAIPCRLAALGPVADKWSDQAIQAFQDTCIEKELKAKFDGKCDDKFDVVLYDPSETDGSSINQKMVTLGHAKAQTKPGKEEPNSVQLDQVSNQLKPVSTQFEPVSVPTQFEPVSVPTQFEPVSVPTQFEPVSVPTQFEPVSVPTQFEPVSDQFEDVSNELESESRQSELTIGQVALNSEALEPRMSQVQSINGEKDVVPEQDKPASDKEEIESDKPKLITGQAEPVYDQQEQPIDQVESVSDQPDQLTEQVEPVAYQPETVTDEVNPISNQPESVSGHPEMVTYQSEPVTEQIESLSDQPEPVTGQTEAESEQLGPVIDEVEPMSDKAVIDCVESVSDQPEPVTDQTESVPDQPELITDQKEPKLDTDETEPVSHLPDQVTNQAVPMLGQEKLVTDQTEPVTDQIEPVSDQPELVTDETGSVSGKSEPVTDQLVGDEVSEGPGQTTAEQKSEDVEDETPAQYKKPHLSKGEELDFYFLSAEDPDNMVLQLVQSEQDLNNLAENISNIYDRLAESDLQFKDILPGSVCCAKFSDGLWYRAEVVSIESNQVTVYFVDYGNTETVDSSDVRKLCSELADLPTQALHCGISGIEATSETWSCQVKEALEELCNGGVVRGVVADMEDDGKILLSSCTVEGVDLVQQLLDRRLAVREGEEPEGSELSSEPQDTGSEAVSSASQDDVESCTPSETEGSIRLAARQVKAGDQLNVVVTNVVTPDLFWCQDVEADLPRINAYCELCQETVQSPKVNDLCCALYSEDQTWYRAKILDVVSSKMLTVQFIDFGSLETVSPVNTRPLDAEMAALPPCALECSMSDIQGRTTDTGGWSPEAVLFFEDLVQDKTFRVLVDEVTSEGAAKVELYSECEEKTVSQLMVVSGHARRKAGSVQSGSMDSLSGYTGTSTAESASPAPGSEAGEQMEKEDSVQPGNNLPDMTAVVEQVEQTVVSDMKEIGEQASEVRGADVELQNTAVADAEVVVKPAVEAGDMELQDPAAVGTDAELQSSAAADANDGQSGHPSQAKDVTTGDALCSEMGPADNIAQTLTVPSDTSPSCQTPTNRPSVSSFYTPRGEVSLSFATDRAMSPSSVLEVTDSEWTTFEETVGSSPESGSQQEDSSVSPADILSGPPMEEASPDADEEQSSVPSNTLPSSSDIKTAKSATSVENGTLSEINGITDSPAGKEIEMSKQEVHTNGDVETIGEPVYQV